MTRPAIARTGAILACGIVLWLLWIGVINAASTTVRLLLLDQQALTPVASATVQVGDGGKTFVSDSSGAVTIPVDVGDRLALRLSHVGYKSVRIELDVSDRSSPQVVYLEPRAVTLSSMVVADEVQRSDRLESGIAHQLRGKQLDRQLKQTLAATLADEAGLAMRAMGPAPARPVLRGLGADRVMITEDGAKAVDLSATSPDHAVTVEPFTVNEIEVLRGPQVLQHSSTTIGGVVNVARGEIPKYLPSRVQGQVGAYGETVSEGGLAAAQLEGGWELISVRGEVSRKSTDDIHSALGRIENTDSRSTDFGLGAAAVFGRSGIGAGLHMYDLEYGIPGGFVGAHPFGVRIDMLKRRHAVRAWTHPKGSWIDSVQMQFARTYYRHKEFEAAGLIGSEFRIVDYFGRLDLRHGALGPFTSGAIGADFEYRDFDIGGFVFTPPSVSRSAAVYMHQTGKWDGWRLDVAVRADFRDIEPKTEVPDADIGHIRAREFATWSASASLFRSLMGSWRAGVMLSRSARQPTIEELYSEGPHLAAYSYEVGNPELEAETGWGAELVSHLGAESIQATASVFIYDLEDYIIPRNTGDTNYQTFLPVYASQGVPAVLTGFEFRSEVALARQWKAHASISYTNGEITDSDQPLPMIPPLKGTIDLQYSSGWWVIGQECEWAADQTRVDQFEKPTAGYALFNTLVQYQRPSGPLIHSVTMAVDNLLNTEYRNHLSRIKSIFPEAGRGVRVTYRLYF
ncbi:TonB-dependent receptor [candidate division GN15 bacterium]|nr:TonB-dependent receptor [candidate division GN15 bacterium]